MNESAVGNWADVERLLGGKPLGSILRLPKYWLPHPTWNGMTVTFSVPEGQIADYQKVLPDGGRLHAREFARWYEVHREPRAAPALVRAHDDQNRAQAVVAGGVALGAALGSALGKTEGSVMAGALLGGVAAVLAAAAMEQQNR